MREDTQELAGILSRQNDLLQTVAGYAEAKKEAVIQGDVPKLDSIIRLEAEWMEELEKLESARMTCVRTLAHARGLAEENPTLEALCAGMDEKDREPLLELRGRLKATVSRQMRLNRINEKLIGLQLKQIDIMLNTLTQQPVNTYTGRGRMDEKPAKKQGVFDLTV